MQAMLRRAGLHRLNTRIDLGCRYHAQTIANMREALKQSKRMCALALDTKGPEIRTGCAPRTPHPACLGTGPRGRRGWPVGLTGRGRQEDPGGGGRGARGRAGVHLGAAASRTTHTHVRRRRTHTDARGWWRSARAAFRLVALGCWLRSRAQGRRLLAASTSLLSTARTAGQPGADARAGGL
jgi:hypothetical protein